jgi:hypothetical protein
MYSLENFNPSPTRDYRTYKMRFLPRSLLAVMLPLHTFVHIMQVFCVCLYDAKLDVTDVPVPVPVPPATLTSTRCNPTNVGAHRQYEIRALLCTFESSLYARSQSSAETAGPSGSPLSISWLPFIDFA